MDALRSPLDAFRLAVRRAGGQLRFAKLVGCTQGAISQRLSSGKPLSARFVLRAEEGTGVSRHDLRPDLYPRTSAEPSHSTRSNEVDA